MQVWVVGINAPDCDDWLLEGIFTSEKRALEIATKVDHFIGETTLDEYSEEEESWDVWYPNWVEDEEDDEPQQEPRNI